MNYMHSPNYNKVPVWEIISTILFAILVIIFIVPAIVCYVGCLVFAGKR